MKIEHIRCMKLPKGVPIARFETLDEALATITPERGVEIFNLYGQQKGALVEARDLLSEHVEKVFGFPMKSHTEPKKGSTTGETVTVYDETETEHIDRFVASLVDGSFTLEGVTIEGDSADKKVEFVWSNVLQPVADKFELKIDLTKTAREKKEKLPPKSYLEKADLIVKNGSQAKWAKTFKKDGVEFADFQTADAAANRLNLAWAIKAHVEATLKYE